MVVSNDNNSEIQLKCEQAYDRVECVHIKDTTHSTEIEHERCHKTTVTKTKTTQVHLTNGTANKIDITADTDDLNVILQRKLRERRMLDMEIEQLQSRMMGRSAFE